jgi:hypothetical protein
MYNLLVFSGLGENKSPSPHHRYLKKLIRLSQQWLSLYFCDCARNCAHCLDCAHGTGTESEWNGGWLRPFTVAKLPTSFCLLNCTHDFADPLVVERFSGV